MAKKNENTKNNYRDLPSEYGPMPPQAVDLEEAVLDGLDAMNFQDTTPVQELTIPVILEVVVNRDL